MLEVLDVFAPFDGSIFQVCSKLLWRKASRDFNKRSCWVDELLWKQRPELEDL